MGDNLTEKYRHYFKIVRLLNATDLRDLFLFVYGYCRGADNETFINGIIAGLETLKPEGRVKKV